MNPTVPPRAAHRPVDGDGFWALCRRGLVALLLGGVLAGCGVTYTPDQLAVGLPLDVDDREGLVESAWLISLEEVFEPPRATRAAEQVRRPISMAAAVDASGTGYEVIVAYVTGCPGRAPDVAVYGEDGIVVVDTVKHIRGDCPDSQILEAIGIDFTSARAGRPVTVRHRLERPWWWWQ